MSDRVSIDQMASAIMEGLTEYAELATDQMKTAVKKSAKTVKDEISANAPRRTGRYAKSWTMKTTKESADALEVTVYSKKPGLPHLLEHGHAKRGGGRVAARPHITAAEQHGIEELEAEIERGLSHG